MMVIDWLYVNSDAIGVEVWRAVGEHEGADNPVDPRLAPVQGYAERRAGD
jgi:hypothetical protein